MEFEWNLDKEIENIRKHRIAFGEAVECFRDPLGFALIDEAHSNRDEDRFYWVGKSTAGRVLTIRFVRRGSKIRIFGAAEWRKFRELYNERTKGK